MNLNIKPLNDTAKQMYDNHGHFHEGDAGLDLYILENQIFLPGDTQKIKLGISCEPLNHGVRQGQVEGGRGCSPVLSGSCPCRASTKHAKTTTPPRTHSTRR